MINNVSPVTYNRTIHLYFLDVKFQPLGICCFQHLQEETPTFLLVQDRFGAILEFFGGNKFSK